MGLKNCLKNIWRNLRLFRKPVNLVIVALEMDMDNLKILLNDVEKIRELHPDMDVDIRVQYN